MKMKMSFWIMVGICLSILAGCSDQQAAREKEAERMYVTARDLEEDLASLQKAVDRYLRIAEQYPKTQAGRKARDRHRQLLEAQELLAQLETAPADSAAGIYRQVCSVLPDYPPVVRKLGSIYVNNTFFLGPTAAKLKDRATAERVLGIWAAQDSLWSKYSFRPIHADREWRDRLCQQAVDVARMLEAFDRYSEALEIVNRGVAYAAGGGAIAHAQVFASYYMYSLNRLADAIAQAKEALAYEGLSDEDRARSYHVIGLCYTYLFQDTGELSDLDAGIKALNEAVNIDPSMGEARELLKVLRMKRQRTPS